MTSAIVKEIRTAKKLQSLSKEASIAMFPLSSFRGQRRASVTYLIQSGHIEAVESEGVPCIAGKDVHLWGLLK